MPTTKNRAEYTRQLRARLKAQGRTRERRVVDPDDYSHPASDVRVGP